MFRFLVCFLLTLEMAFCPLTCLGGTSGGCAHAESTDRSCGPACPESSCPQRAPFPQSAADRQPDVPPAHGEGCECHCVCRGALLAERLGLETIPRPHLLVPEAALCTAQRGTHHPDFFSAEHTSPPKVSSGRRVCLAFRALLI